MPVVAILVADLQTSKGIARPKKRCQGTILEENVCGKQTGLFFAGFFVNAFWSSHIPLVSAPTGSLWECPRNVAVSAGKQKWLAGLGSPKCDFDQVPSCSTLQLKRLHCFTVDTHAHALNTQQ